MTKQAESLIMSTIQSDDQEAHNIVEIIEKIKAVIKDEPLNIARDSLASVLFAMFYENTSSFKHAERQVNHLSKRLIASLDVLYDLGCPKNEENVKLNRDIDEEEEEEEEVNALKTFLDHQLKIKDEIDEFLQESKRKYEINDPEKFIDFLNVLFCLFLDEIQIYAVAWDDREVVVDKINNIIDCCTKGFIKAKSDMLKMYDNQEASKSQN